MNDSARELAESSKIRKDAEELDMSIIDILRRLEEISDETSARAELIQQLPMWALELEHDSSGTSIDYLGREGGPNQNRFYLYSGGRTHEVDRFGRDRIETFKFRLKRLRLPEYIEYHDVSSELENLEDLLEVIKKWPERANEIEPNEEEQRRLKNRKRGLRSEIESKFSEFEEAMQEIPAGTILFLKSAHSNRSYPVKVIERDGEKWIETMTDETPDSMPGHGKLKKGFQQPIRQFTENGDLYLPVGLREND